MNRNDCDIARDLMPLSIDGVCSDGSQRFLDEHVAACPTCQSLYARMKTIQLPEYNAEPNQEAQALKRGLKYLGKRFKALWIALAALVCAFVVLLAIGGVQQMRWHWTADAPVESYNLQLTRDGIAATLRISSDFPAQTYNGSACDVEYVTDSPENRTGSPQAVILTYSVSYFPYQAEDILKTVPFVQPFQPRPQEFVDTEYRNPALLLDDFMYQGALHNQRLCVEDGKLYLADKLSSAYTTTGRTLLVVTPGLPVSEIRYTDGKTTFKVYTWGDEIPRTSDERYDEYGLPQSGMITPSDLEKYADYIID